MIPDYMKSGRAKIIYLATPYSHKSRAVEEARFRTVTIVSGLLITRGVINFSPITQSHEQNRMINLPGSWDFWKDVDTEFLHRCDELHVLAVSGWQVSQGVLAEIEIMKGLGKPIKYIHFIESTMKLVYIDEMVARGVE
jgi:hypothetical protein